MVRLLLLVSLLFKAVPGHAEDGYSLWLRYQKVTNNQLLTEYRERIACVNLNSSSNTLRAAKEELLTGLAGLLAKKISVCENIINNEIIAGTPLSSRIIRAYLATLHHPLGREGYFVQVQNLKGKHVIIIAGDSDVAVLYGVFAFLRMLQTHRPIAQLSLIDVPKIQNRILEHWDNLNRSVERGYAGLSIWNWHELPDYVDKRYIDYARANASIGINGTVLTNVNANSIVLTKQYLSKVKALADVFRVYGIRVYLTAKFNAPVEIGGLKTADPLDSSVCDWWKNECNEIYNYIPDFGGFLIKANSEGQPGPQTYGRTHADGANMFADALAPHGGIVIWRAFVYGGPAQNNENHFQKETQAKQSDPIALDDRTSKAYLEFKPLDGKFRDNVLLQVKNGPLDFQPREPFSPLFGAMPLTAMAAEFQLTQEYLGQGTHLVFEAPLFKEVLDVDTYAKGKGSTVASIIDGSSDHHSITGIAGVSNIGNDINWTGHPFAQANWYAFGRLAWDYDLTSSEIATEWLQQTFTNNVSFVEKIKHTMLQSRECVVNYMMPLGLHHIMGTGHHYGPAPWVENAGRPDWNPVYYHRADADGIGFNRTSTGSDAIAQYAPEMQKHWIDSNTCDPLLLLWFHHVSWAHKMQDGNTLWDELCMKYQEGVDSVRSMQHQWNEIKPFIDSERFKQVKMLLNIQEEEAVWWRNACLLYFQTFSKMPIPANVGKPDKPLAYYQHLTFPYSPGIDGNL